MQGTTDTANTPDDGCKTYATTFIEKVLPRTASEAFVDDLSTELRMGFGFTPFIGAGLSAPSGAPLVREILPYLQRCIGLALGVEERGMRAWNPRTDHWPPFTDRDRMSDQEWMTRP
jgi:hypothetical protein